MKKIKITIASLVLLAGAVLVPNESVSKDQGFDLGSCCPFYGQVCMYGGIVVADHYYSSGSCLVND